MNNNIFNRRFLALFAVFCVVIVMAYIAAVTFYPLSQTGVKYADMAVPLLLGSVVVAIVGFFYGSSQKQETTFPQPAKVDVEVKP